MRNPAQETKGSNLVGKPLGLRIMVKRRCPESMQNGALRGIKRVKFFYNTMVKTGKSGSKMLHFLPSTPLNKWNATSQRVNFSVTGRRARTNGTDFIVVALVEPLHGKGRDKKPSTRRS